MASAGGTGQTRALRMSLAVALLGVLFCAALVHGDPLDSLVPSVRQITRLAAQRGPIRRHVETAFSSSFVKATADTLEVSLEEAREDLMVPHDDWSGRRSYNAAPRVQVGPPPRAGSTSYRQGLLFAAILLTTLCIAVAVSFKNV